MSNVFGVELILDIHNCDVSRFTREEIKRYLDELCALIDMEQTDLYFWDYDGPYGHLDGVSAVQFIQTSAITLHTLTQTGVVHVNIFSCKVFEPSGALNFTAKFFRGKIKHQFFIERN